MEKQYLSNTPNINNDIPLIYHKPTNMENKKTEIQEWQVQKKQVNSISKKHSKFHQSALKGSKLRLDSISKLGGLSDPNQKLGGLSDDKVLSYNKKTTNNYLTEDQMISDQDVHLAVPLVKPIRRYWCGFHDNGKERWFIELDDGKIISQKDKSFMEWNKKLEATS